MAWYEKFGWRENPFTIDPIPESLVIDDIKNKVMEHIESENIVNLYGESGSGKSTILNWFKKNLGGKYQPIYLNFSVVSDYASSEASEDRQYEGFKKNIEDETFGSLLDTFINRFSKMPLIKRLEGRFKNKTLVLLLDEAGEVKDERISAYIRTLNDGVKCATVITSVKPLSDIDIFKASLRIARIAEYVKMRKISYEEAGEMLKERITSAGGDGIHPFDDKTVKRMTDLAGNSPRKVLDIAADTLREMALKGEDFSSVKITPEDLVLKSISGGPRTEKTERADAPEPKEAAAQEAKEKESQKQTPKPTGPKTDEIFKELTDNQQRIIRALENNSMNMVDLKEKLDLSTEAISTELYRLMLMRDQKRMRNKGMDAPAIVRTKEKPYTYSLSSEWRMGLVKE